MSIVHHFLAGMGTKLQFAINPLAAAAASSSNNSYIVNQLSSDCGYSPEIGSSNHFNCSVNAMFDSQNIESIKKTMLMHEDIFKIQVRELHRLYERQMKLMYELKNEMTQNRSTLNIQGSKSSEFSIWHQQIRDIKSDLPIYGLTEDPRELSGSCSGESPRMPKGFNLERIDEERPSRSIRGIEQDQKGSTRTNYGADEEIDVELTLSIGCSSSKKRSNSSGLDNNGGDNSCSSSSLINKEKAEDKVNPSRSMSQNIGRSNWIFQDLSLNRT